MTTAKKKAPQDRKPKAAARLVASNGDGPGYAFTHDGHSYRLPPADALNVPAGEIMDAVEAGGDLAELRLGMAFLKAADIDPDTMAALRAMPLRDFGPLIGDWLRVGGVQAGES